jgi:hypothetical protein
MAKNEKRRLHTPDVRLSSTPSATEEPNCQGHSTPGRAMEPLQSRGPRSVNRPSNERLPKANPPSSKALVKPLKDYSGAAMMSSLAEFAGSRVDPLADARTFLDRYADMLRSALGTENRTVKERQRRAHVFDVVSSLYTALFSKVMQRPDAFHLLQRLERRQRVMHAGMTAARPVGETEALMIELSDLLAILKDPCHNSMWKHRRFGIARAPESAMPLFRLPLRRDVAAETLQNPESLTWLVVADRDALEWVDDPFIDATFTSEAGDEYTFCAPAPNRAGDVPIRRFCRSLGLSRASEYHIRERRKRVGGARVVKEDSDIVGLYESCDGLVVNLEAYALDIIDRRTVRWSKLVPEKKAPEPARGEDQNLLAAPPAPTSPITPSEELLAFLLAKEAADSEAECEKLRREYIDEIEAERKAGIFVLPDITIDLP